MSEVSRNRLANSGNPYQGSYKRVLCVCSAGLLRSPTTALVLSQEPYNFNTRACGLEGDFALIPIDEVLLAWADEVVCMTKTQEVDLKDMMKKKNCRLICLDIPDNYSYRDPELMELIRKSYDKSQAKKIKKTKKDEKSEQKGS